jgi:hypothetical protein
MKGFSNKWGIFIINISIKGKMPIGEWNEFKTYAWRSGAWVKKGEKRGERKQTHLLLDGGILSVHSSKEQEFLEHYARALFDGQDLYVVEMKSTPCFFFMSEFDIKMAERNMNDEEIQLFVRIVQSVVSKAFPTLDCNVGVSTPPSKQAKTNDGRDCVQSGIHMNWRIPVDLPTAWVLRSWIVRELDVAMPTANHGILEPWTSGYDPCVLLDNGLRMIGSKKAEKCPECKGATMYKKGAKATATGPAFDKVAPAADEVGSVCHTCQSVGRIDKGRPYTLVMVADAEGNPIQDAIEYYRDPRNVVDLVKFLSIRCPTGNPEYEKTSEIVFPDEATGKKLVESAKLDKRNSGKRDTAQEKKKKKKKDDDKGQGAEQVQDAAAKKRQEKRDELNDVGPDDPVFDSVSKYIVSQFRGAPIVSRIKKTGSGDCYIINTRCNFCENKVPLTPYFITQLTSSVDRVRITTILMSTLCSSLKAACRGASARTSTTGRYVPILSARPGRFQRSSWS